MIDWSTKKILVAEDEDMNYFLIQETLRKYDVTLFRATTGTEAISIFKENLDINLILMDIKMPEINGYEATKIIKSIKNVPIIAQTAYTPTGKQNEIKLAGFDDFITKPIRIKELVTLIEKYL